MKLYRIFLGRNIGNKEKVSPIQMLAFIERAVAPAFDAFTVFHAEGYWKGTHERTTVIEVIGESLLAAKAEAVATMYKEQFNQEAVLITTSNVSIRLV